MLDINQKYAWLTYFIYLLLLTYKLHKKKVKVTQSLKLKSLNSIKNAISLNNLQLSHFTRLNTHQMHSNEASDILNVFELSTLVCCYNTKSMHVAHMLLQHVLILET